jgi:hypothetical protein
LSSFACGTQVQIATAVSTTPRAADGLYFLPANLTHRTHNDFLRERLFDITREHGKRPTSDDRLLGEHDEDLCVVVED